MVRAAAGMSRLEYSPGCVVGAAMCLYLPRRVAPYPPRYVARRVGGRCSGQRRRRLGRREEIQGDGGGIGDHVGMSQMCPVCRIRRVSANPLKTPSAVPPPTSPTSSPTA